MTEPSPTSAAPEAEAYDAWAPYYDVADADRAPFIAFYSTLLDGVDSLAELGCGTLLAALRSELVSRGPGKDPRVVGIDASRGMLQIATRRDPGIDWRYGDIRAPGVDGRFDLIFSGFNTFQHLLQDEDLASAFSSARALLSARGRFAFDIYQPNIAYVSHRRADSLARSLQDAEGRALEIREDSDYDPVSRVLTLDWRLIARDEPGAAPLATTRYRLRQYFADDIERHLAGAGLLIDRRYGDFDRSPFTASSRKQVVVCRSA